jgi:hypothetical protein
MLGNDDPRGLVDTRSLTGPPTYPELAMETNAFDRR